MLIINQWFEFNMLSSVRYYYQIILWSNVDFFFFDSHLYHWLIKQFISKMIGNPNKADKH